MFNKKQYNKQWKKDNPEKMREYSLRYYFKNKERIKYYHREYMRNKSKTDPHFRLNHHMRKAIGETLKGKKKGKKWTILVGYTIKDLKNHLERQFTPAMNWNNYGDYWHIDHIKPISLFRFNNSHSLEFKNCWALNNLQPLEKTANMKKYNKYIVS